MARRKDDNIVEIFYGLFMRIPPWLCIPIALLAFAAINVFIMALASANPLTTPLAGIGPMIGGLVALLILLAGFKATMERWARQKILAKQTGLASIRELSWASFELLVGQAYRQQGYQVIETGGGGPDGGVDLRLLRDGANTIVQCKQWKTWKVGVKSIRELYGVLMAEKADKAIFVTSGVYTKEAREFSKGKPLELIDGEALLQLIRSVQASTQATPSTRATGLHCTVDAFPQPPVCPRCRGSMILRTAKRGANAGSQFWGCSAYPKCTGTMSKVG